MILLSIITIAKNSESSIQETLESVANNFVSEKIEYIIIDGASTDDTIVHVKESKIFDKITLISEPDRGISDAFNKGINIARGKYLLFLNSDDILFQNTLKNEVLDYLVSTSDDLLAFDMYLNDRGKMKRLKPNTENIYKKMTVFHPSLLMNRESVIKAGRYNENFSLVMDYDLILRMLYKGNSIAYLETELPLSVFTVGGATLTHRFRGLLELFSLDRELKGYSLALASRKLISEYFQTIGYFAIRILR